MDQKLLQVFLSVCATRNFTHTATDLHMSVSAVSRAIARLEDDLGQVLFDRDRRGIRPTSAAQRLRPYADNAIAEWRALQQSFREGGAVAGELRIYCSVTASRRLLSPLLKAYRSAHPAVDVRLQTGDQADGLEQVRSGRADVAMIASPQQLPASIAFRPVEQSPLLICLPPGGSGQAPARPMRQRSRRAYQAAELSNRAWILPERGVTRDITDAWLRSHFDREPPVYARVAGHEAIAAMVALGLGVGIVPRLVVEASGLADELELRAAPDLPFITIGLCARAGRVADPVVAALFECIA